MGWWAITTSAPSAIASSITASVQSRAITALLISWRGSPVSNPHCRNLPAGEEAPAIRENPSVPEATSARAPFLNHQHIVYNHPGPIPGILLNRPGMVLVFLIDIVILQAIEG